MAKPRKINGRTVRGGWSQNNIIGKIDNKLFTLFAEDSYTISNNQLRYLKKKIEMGKLKLPEPITAYRLYKVTNEKNIISVK